MTRKARTLWIGPFEYEIRLVPQLTGDDGARCKGLESHEDTRIELDTDQSAQSMWATLWHEAIHAILDHAGFEAAEHHERTINAVSHGICQILRDNPQMADLDELREFAK